MSQAENCRTSDIYNATQPTRVSITGIDGAGKDSVARDALRMVAEDHRVVKLGRPAYLFERGREQQIFSKITGAFDRIHRVADCHRSPASITIANALNVITQTRLLEPLVMRSDPKPELLVSSRDPRIDPAVYLSYYAPRKANRLSFDQRVERMQKLTNVSRNLVIRLCVDPELAVTRIQDRMIAEQETRSEICANQAGMRDKWGHMHENATDLAMLADGYGHALHALRRIVPTAVVEIDTDNRDRHEVASLVQSTISASMNGSIDSGDWYRL
ncbi:MAG: hypothetical protein WC498_01490 [Candidatus Saccharimonadales bacterium]